MSPHGNQSAAHEFGFLLIGHGTRDERGQREFAETVRQITERLAPLWVEPAFLEFVEPPIPTGFDRLVERGANRIVVAPLLLFAAGHAQQDIPAAVTAAAGRHEGVRWQQAAHLGCHPALLELSAQRTRAVLEGRSPESGPTRLLLIGRGSRDPDATRETHRYAELLSRQVGIADVAVGFLAMAQPSLTEVLAEAVRAECASVVVVPHLLFHGELLSEIRRTVDEWQLRCQHKRWQVAEHLGPSEQVVAAVVDRCREAVVE